MNSFFENKRAVRNLYFIIGCLVFSALFVMAGLFYIERVCMADTACRTVVMIITQRPAIFLLRFGSFVPQLLPLSAIWLHVSLKTVMIVNSLSFVILFFCIYLLAFRFSADSLLFLLVPLYLIMLTNEEFYWPQSEYQQGMVWLCLYAVLLFGHKFNSSRAIYFFLIQTILMCWIQSFHLLIFVPLFFLIIYFYYTRSSLFSKAFFVHASICLVLFFSRWIIGKHNPYEGSRVHLGTAFRKEMPHFFSLGSVAEFWHKLPLEYAGYVIAFFVSACWFISARKYLMFNVLVSFSVFYWLIIILTTPEASRFYTEYLMLPLGFIVLLPLIVEIIPVTNGPYAIALVLIFCTVRIATIYHSHIDYTRRLDIYQPYFDHIKKNKLNGVFVDSRLVDQKKAIITWASGFESILISSLHSPDSCMTVQFDSLTDINRYGYFLNQDTDLVTVVGIWGKSQLPKRYFKLQGGKYEILTKQP